MAHEDNYSIGVFMDGGYFAKINEGLTGGKQVNLKTLLDFICRKISQDKKMTFLFIFYMILNYFPTVTVTDLPIR